MEIFGGPGDEAVRRMAHRLDIPQSTIYSWLRNGRIPKRQHPRLLAEAQKLSLSLLPEDLGSAVDAAASADHLRGHSRFRSKRDRRPSQSLLKLARLAQAPWKLLCRRCRHADKLSGEPRLPLAGSGGLKKVRP